MKKKKTEAVKITLEGHELPLHIFREQRRSFRAAIGKDAFILRMPQWLNDQQEQEGLRWFRQWAEKKIRADHSLLTQLRGRPYTDGEVIRVGSRTYTLRIHRADRKTHAARLRDGVIKLDLSTQQEGPSLHKAIRQLISRVVAQDFAPAITRRVHELNDRHFRKPIKGVRLKYNHSNWGSCSRQGNINLSTRLLFAPDPVIDYVIVHELAHLVEMNHSPRFWQLVAGIVPDYRDHEKWLRDHRNDCDF